jgi:hypothetical protein
MRNIHDEENIKVIDMMEVLAVYEGNVQHHLHIIKQTSSSTQR